MDGAGPSRQVVCEALGRTVPFVVVRDRRGSVVWVSATFDDVEVERTEDLRSAEERVARGGDPETVEIRCSWGAGGTGWAQLRVFGVPVPGGDRLVGSMVTDVTERRLAEDRMRLLLDRLPVVFTVTDLDGRVRSVTGSTLMSPRFEAEGGTLDGLVPVGHPAREEVLRLFRTALGGVPASGRYLWKGRWTQGHTTPQVRDGEVVGVLGVAFDVHELVTADHARSSAEEQFRLFVDRSPAAAAIRDDAGNYTWVNDAARRAFGVPDAVRTPFAAHAVFPSAVAGELESMHRRLKVSAGAEAGIWRVPLPHGEVHILGHRFAFTDSEGRYREGNVGLDVTERVAANRESARWRDRYRALFDRAPLPMAVLSAAGVVLDANPALCELLGSRLSELRGTPISRLHPPGGSTGAEEQWAGLLAGSKPSVAFTQAYLTGAGRVVVATATCFPVSGDEDDTRAVVAVLRPHQTESEEAPRTVQLSDNEAAVLEAKALGMSHEQTAGALELSRRGVDYHLSRLAHRMRCANNTSLIVARAYHLGLLEQKSWPPRVPDRFRATASGELDGRTPVRPTPLAPGAPPSPPAR